MKHLSEDEAQQQFIRVVATILRRLLQPNPDSQGQATHADAPA